MSDDLIFLGLVLWAFAVSHAKAADSIGVPMPMPQQAVSSAPGKASLQLQQVRVVELARVVFSELLLEDYIFDASFLAEGGEVTVDVRNLSKAEARDLVVSTAQSFGFVVERVGRVTRFGRARPPDALPEPELLHYRPKFRSVGYLADLVTTLFPAGSFSFQKGQSGAGQFLMPGMVPGMSAIPPGVVVGSGPAGQGSVNRVPSGGPPSALDGARLAAGGGGYPPGVGQSSGTAGAVVDQKLDAFIFKGQPKDIARLEKLLAQVDVAAGEVMVRAVVYEVRKTAQDQGAVQIAMELLKGKLGVTFGIPATGNTLSLTVAGFSAIVSAFATDSRFKSVSAPSVRVQSGQAARFTVGNETPVLGAVTFQQGGNAVQSVEYRPSGVILEIKPIVRDEIVELDIKQQLSSFAVTTSGVNNSPTMLKRDVSTFLGVKPGETVVIGGLEDSRLSNDRAGLSFLPRWLDSKGENEDRTEVLLVVDVQRIGG